MTIIDDALEKVLTINIKASGKIKDFDVDSFLFALNEVSEKIDVKITGSFIEAAESTPEFFDTSASASASTWSLPEDTSFIGSPLDQPEIVSLIKDGKKIQAIKEWRAISKKGLKESKEDIDHAIEVLAARTAEEEEDDLPF